MLFEFCITVLKAIFVIGVAMQTVPLMIYLERKISAYVQGRLGLTGSISRSAGCATCCPSQCTG